jgi:hypothetical protein
MLLYIMLCLQWPLARLLQSAWSGGIGQCSISDVVGLVIIFYQCVLLTLALFYNKVNANAPMNLLYFLYFLCIFAENVSRLITNICLLCQFFQLVSSSNLGRGHAQEQSHTLHLNELMLSPDLFCPDIQ